MPQYAVAKSMRDYNLMVSASYMQRHYPENNFIPQGLSEQDGLLSIIAAHTNESMPQLMRSPFASSSISEREASRWAKDRTKNINGAKHGIVFEAYVPNYGSIFTFGESVNTETYSDLPGLKGLGFGHPLEEEILIPGGILPAEIKKITVYDLGSDYRAKDTRVGFEASTWFYNGEQFLEIVDHRVFGTEGRAGFKKYKLNTATSKFELLVV